MTQVIPCTPLIRTVDASYSLYPSDKNLHPPKNLHTPYARTILPRFKRPSFPAEPFPYARHSLLPRPNLPAGIEIEASGDREPDQPLIALPPNSFTVQFPAKTSKCFTSHSALTSLPRAPYRYTPLYISAPKHSEHLYKSSHSPLRLKTRPPMMIYEPFPDSRLRGPTRTPPRQPSRPTSPARYSPPHLATCSPMVPPSWPELPTEKAITYLRISFAPSLSR